MPSIVGEVEIELTEGEYIAPRGTRHVTWLIRLNDAWVHLSTWPNVEIERCQARSGTVWENRSRLRAPPGTRLIRVTSRPSAYPERDVLDYLARPQSSHQHVLRQEFQVGRRGALLRKS